MVSSVVDQLPGRPRLLAWMCTGCGSFSSSTAWATERMICRGVTPKWSTGESMLATLPDGWFFQTSTPPGLTSLAAYDFAEPSSQPINALTFCGSSC